MSRTATAKASFKPAMEALEDRCNPAALANPAALLSPPPARSKMDVKQVIADMKALRRGQTLGEGLTLRSLIEEGRRF